MSSDVPSSPVARHPLISTEMTYLLPMGVFLAFTWAGGHWPDLFAASYVLKTMVVALLVVAFYRRYTRICWNGAWLGVMVGVLVVVQWVGMEKLLGNYPKMSQPEVFDPFQHFASPWTCWTFIIIRWAGASLLVPVMEETFWRDYLWRTIAAPNDFQLAKVGEWDLKAFIIVAIAFGAGVHFEWITAIVCGLIYGGLLLYTRSLGACIIAHGVTNFLLGAYVLIWRDWKFW